MPGIPTIGLEIIGYLVYLIAKIIHYYGKINPFSLFNTSDFSLILEKFL